MKGTGMMNRSDTIRLAGALLVGIVLVGGSAVAQNRLAGNVRVDGSSTVYPITEAAAEEFGKEHRNVRVTVGISGTGGGFKRFVAGETDISDASRPILKAEADTASKNGIDFIELPVAYDGLSIVVNQENTWAKDITVEEIKKIYADGGPVRSWKDVRSDYPDVPIKIYSPGTDSGTFDYFKEVVIGKIGSIRPDIVVSEDDNVLVRGVVGDKGAIGYFGCAYYFENKDKLTVLAVHNGKTNVLPTPKTIESGEYAPFSRPLFIYVNAKSARQPQVRSFVEFYLENATTLVPEVGYVSLPKVVYERAEANFKAGKVGSQYIDESGNHKHGPVVEIYR